MCFNRGIDTGTITSTSTSYSEATQQPPSWGLAVGLCQVPAQKYVPWRLCDNFAWFCVSWEGCEFELQLDPDTPVSTEPRL